MITLDRNRKLTTKLVLEYGRVHSFCGGLYVLLEVENYVVELTREEKNKDYLTVRTKVYLPYECIGWYRNWEQLSRPLKTVVRKECEEYATKMKQLRSNKK